MASSTPRTRARSVALRYAAACPVTTTEVWALGVRYDEEEPEVAETHLVRLVPGSAERHAVFPGTGVDLRVRPDGSAVILDAAGKLSATSGTKSGAKGAEGLTAVSAPRATSIALHGGDIWAAVEGSIARYSGTSLSPVEGAPTGVVRVAASSAGVVVATAAGVSFSEGKRFSAVPSAGWPAGAKAEDVGALSIDEGGRVLVAVKAAVLGGTTRGLQPLASATGDLECIASFAGRDFGGSRHLGVVVVEDGVVRKLRPSVRARTLIVRGGVLAAAGDLLIASTDDGVEFMTRDLIPFHRLCAEQFPLWLEGTRS